MLMVGRGKETHAYTHSLQAFHHVYLNLGTLKVDQPHPAIHN
jgi:hypothetical protein